MELVKAKKIVNTMLHEIVEVSKQDEFVHGYTDEERFEADLMGQIAFHLKHASHLIQYMNKPIIAVGTLTKNEDGRYTIENNTNHYFHSGSVIEIWDQEEERFFKTYIDHNGSDYFANAYPSLSLEGILARYR